MSGARASRRRTAMRRSRTRRRAAADGFMGGAPRDVGPRLGASDDRRTHADRRRAATLAQWRERNGPKRRFAVIRGRRAALSFPPRGVFSGWTPPAAPLQYRTV